MTDNAKPEPINRWSGQDSQRLRDIPLRVRIIDGSVLAIEIGLDTLRCCIETGPLEGRVIDIDKLADELVVQLANDEDENGMTPLMKVFDDAVEDIYEDGSNWLTTGDDDHDND